MLVVIVVFHLPRGIRQGCRISTVLYIIVAEALAETFLLFYSISRQPYSFLKWVLIYPGFFLLLHIVLVCFLFYLFFGNISKCILIVRYINIILELKYEMLYLC